MVTPRSFQPELYQIRHANAGPRRDCRWSMFPGLGTGQELLLLRRLYRESIREGGNSAVVESDRNVTACQLKINVVDKILGAEGDSQRCCSRLHCNRRRGRRWHGSGDWRGRCRSIFCGSRSFSCTRRCQRARRCCRRARWGGQHSVL